MERIILTIAIIAGLASFFMPVGKRIGIILKGKGKFNFVAVTDRVFWDDVEWSWETP